jgi:hypothetical protein
VSTADNKLWQDLTAQAWTALAIMIGRKRMRPACATAASLLKPCRCNSFPNWRIRNIALSKLRRALGKMERPVDVELPVEV